MKLVRFGERGAEKPGLIDPTGALRDLSGVVPDIGGAVLSPGGLSELSAIDYEVLPVVEDQPRLGPCVGGIGKMICIGRNYAEHAAETGSDVPKEPILFHKAITAIQGAYDAVLIPRGAQKVDYEVELGVVIGTTARYVSEDDALGHVAGYCVVNDVSERDWQKNRGGTWTKGKSADTFGPTGPWLVTADEVGDPQALRLWTKVDGEIRQDGSTKDMIFTVAALIAYISQFMSVVPGDVIATGTPSGVAAGMSPPKWLRDGQTVEMGITGLGQQRQIVGSA